MYELSKLGFFQALGDLRDSVCGRDMEQWYHYKKMSDLDIKEVDELYRYNRGAGLYMSVVFGIPLAGGALLFLNELKNNPKLRHATLSLFMGAGLGYAYATQFLEPGGSLSEETYIAANTNGKSMNTTVTVGVGLFFLIKSAWKCLNNDCDSSTRNVTIGVVSFLVSSYLYTCPWIDEKDIYNNWRLDA